MEEQYIQKIREKLKDTKTITIVFHFNPDGDALGSALALYHYFLDDGYEASVISPNPFPNFLRWMPGAENIIVAQENLTEARKRIKEADMLFVVDMNAPHRAGQDIFCINILHLKSLSQRRLPNACMSASSPIQVPCPTRVIFRTPIRCSGG